MSNRKRKKVNRLQIVFLVLLVVGVAFGLKYYYQAKEAGVFKRVHFVNPDSSKSKTFKLEIADTEEKRGLGLMYRKELAKNEGMLFIFPESKIQSFFMKNTYIPLDMIFIDENKEVVGLLENVPILNDKPRKVAKSSKYVVELNAGIASKNGIKIKSKLID